MSSSGRAPSTATPPAPPRATCVPASRCPTTSTTIPGRPTAPPRRSAISATIRCPSTPPGSAASSSTASISASARAGASACSTPGAATAAIGATEDGSGFQLFAGACSGALTRAALTRSWLIATYDPARPSPLRGEATARLKDLRAGAQRNCPERLNAAFTAWHTADVRYRTAPGQGVPVTLPSLVSEHYGGGDPATADHVERFYFTRELGLTRWERWQNSRGNRQYDAAAVAAAAARFAATGRCSAAPPPEGAAMVLVDCREWTRIVPPDASTGDPPGFFIAALRARGVPAAAWFAPRD